MNTIVDLVETSCLRFPDKAALRHKIGGIWQDISYETLRTASDRVAAGLLNHGFKAGDHAAMLASSSPSWVVAYVGILKAGGIVVPVDKELKSGELRHILTDSDTQVLFAESPYFVPVLEMADQFPSLRQIVIFDGTLLHGSGSPGPVNSSLTNSDDRQGMETQLAIPETAETRMGTLAAQVNLLLKKEDSLNGAETEIGETVLPTGVVSGDGTGRIRLLTFEELLGDARIAPVKRHPCDTAVILYTSGTTGRSKGAMLSHANIVSNLTAVTEHLGLDETIHTLSFLPINHVFEQVCGILAPLSLGGTVSFCQSLKKIGDNLPEVKPTFLLGVPAVYRKILDRIMKNIASRPISRFLFYLPITRPLIRRKIRRSLGSGTMFISGGAALDPAIARGLEKVGLAVCQGYGITETSPIISVERPGDKRPGTVGRALPGIEVKIANPDEEGVGEILVKGPNVMQGYYKNPPATAEVMADGWYRSGDLGSLDEDGFLTIRGRVKNLIVTSNGRNVYPEEVENELLKSPFIAEVMVYGKKVAPATEEIHATIFPDPEALDEYGRKHGKNPMTTGDKELLLRVEVANACKRLAPYKRVRNFTIREDGFPKTTTRKIKRFEVDACIPREE